MRLIIPTVLCLLLAYGCTKGISFQQQTKRKKLISVSYTANESGITSQDFAYNADNKLVKARLFDTSGIKEELQFEYNKNGDLRTKKLYDAGGRLIRSWNFGYAEGKLIEVAQLNRYGALQVRDSNFVYEKGKVIEYKTYNGQADAPRQIVKCTYDGRGNVTQISKTLFDQHGEESSGVSTTMKYSGIRNPYKDLLIADNFSPIAFNKNYFSSYESNDGGREEWVYRFLGGRFPTAISHYGTIEGEEVWFETIFQYE